MAIKTIYQKLVNALFFLILLTLSNELLAQDESKTEELRLNIQLRPRAEVRNGLFTPILEGQQPATFISQRSRVGLTYSKHQKLKIGVSMQVVNTWGNDPQVQATANNISLYEGWAQLNFTPAWNLKVGRQVFSYDDERILGSLDWNNAGRKHDAVLLGFGKNKLTINLAAAYSQNGEKVTGTFYDSAISQPYKGMEFLWSEYKFTDAFTVSALVLNIDIQSRSDSLLSHLQTAGANIFYKKNKLNLAGTYYYQAGKNSVKNSSSIKTNAWMAAVKADYHFNDVFGIGAGSDYLSGRDMNAASSRITYFNPLYGTHHKFYGFMDYFYAASGHNNTGLWDSYLNLNLNSSKKMSWQAALHHFESTAKVVSYTGSVAGSSLGNELDLTFKCTVMDDVKLSGGYSQMFVSPSMKYVKGILPLQHIKPLQNWVWLSLNINPDILILKSK